MKNGFDPYYKWLGIPPKDQPPNHYRLLGIEFFESDRDVIDAAANRVMAYLKDLAVGDEAEDSQKLLNEVARARLCLLNNKKKAAYDQTLREELAAASAAAESPDAAGIPPSVEPPPLGEGIAPAARHGEVVPPALPPASEPRAKVPPLRPPLAEPPRQQPAIGTRRESRHFSLAAVVIIACGVLAVGGLAVFALVMARRSSSSTEPVEIAVAPPPVAKLPPEPVEPRKTMPAKPRVRPQPKRRLPVDDADTPLPPMSAFLPQTAEIGPAGLNKPQNGLGESPTKLPADFPNPSSPGTSPGSSPFSQAPGMMPELPKPPTDGKTLPTMSSPEGIATGAWRDLPAAVALLVPASTDAGRQMPLGKVHLSPAQPCSLKLLGGETACRGSQAIVLRAVSGETVERHWGIVVRGPAAGNEIEIARLAVGDDGALGLEWQPAAVTDPVAPQLANCVLSLETASESHRMLLREAAQVDELVVDLEKPTHEGEWKLDAAPKAEEVKVEVLGLGGLKYSVEPANAVPAEKSEVWVQIEDGGSLLSLQVEASLKRTFQVEVTPHMRLTAEAKPERLIFRKLPQLQAQVSANHQQLLLAAQQLRFARRQVRTAQDQAALEQQVALNEQMCKEAESTVSRFGELETLLGDKDNKLAIQLRVFYDAEGCEVDLLRVGTPPAKPPAADTPGQAAKTAR